MGEMHIRTDFKKNARRGRRHKRPGGVRTAVPAALLFLCLCSVLVLGFFWKAGSGAGNVTEFPAIFFPGHAPAGRTRTGNAGQGAQGSFAQRQSASQGSPVPDTAAQDTGTAAPWYLTLVNGQHPIPQDYQPELVKVPGGESVDARIYDSLMQMLEDAKEGNCGELPRVVSGYRTARVQQALYNDKIAEYQKEGYSKSEAEELAGQWVALPGFSEHQLGFAVDINGAAYDLYLWLQENSYKYGFIFRYPGDKTDITGVAEEVWHYRYVGTEAAARIYEQGLCLEEYLENIPSVR